MCPFLHPDDVRTDVNERTEATRLRIYKAMSADNFALPPIIRLEIGEITQEEYEEIEHKQFIHEQNVLENKGKAGGRGQRTARTRSPRSNPRTPTPDNTIDNRGKGQNKGKGQHEGKGPTPAETMAAAAAPAEVLEEADNRQRDHTSGQDDASDAEIAAPIPADSIEVETETPMITTVCPTSAPLLLRLRRKLMKLWRKLMQLWMQPIVNLLKSRVQTFPRFRLLTHKRKLVTPL